MRIEGVPVLLKKLKNPDLEDLSRYNISKLVCRLVSEKPPLRATILTHGLKIKSATLTTFSINWVLRSVGLNSLFLLKEIGR